MLVAANSIHSRHLSEHLKEDITLICKENTNHGHKYLLFEDARKQLEKFSLNFSSCSPFLFPPSAAKDTNANSFSVLI